MRASYILKELKGLRFDSSQFTISTDCAFGWFVLFCFVFFQLTNIELLDKHR